MLRRLDACRRARTTGRASTAEGDAIRAQRRAGRVFDEPILVLLKHVRVGFGDERRHPDRRLEPAFLISARTVRTLPPNGPGFQPIAHRPLITVVIWMYFSAGRFLAIDVEVVEHLRCRHIRPKQYTSTIRSADG